VRTVVFLDLDDTILQTRPKCPPGEPLLPAARGRDGAPLSFTTGRQRALFELLAASATVVPTTARNLDAFRRVDLPFDSFAVLDFGGVVLLPDGRPDPDWDERIRPQALAAADELAAARCALQAAADRLGLDAPARVIEDFGMPLYALLKCRGAGGVLKEMSGFDAGHFRAWRSDGQIALVPRFLGKGPAVRHLIDNRLGPGPVLTVGAGDSPADAGFLAECDFCLLPRKSMLAERALGEDAS